jgi:hypothetical protein
MKSGKRGPLIDEWRTVGKKRWEKRFMVFIFLDTNIVQCLWSFGEFLYDSSISEEDVKKAEMKWGAQLVQELGALHDIVFVAQRGSLPIAVSMLSVDEFEKTPNRVKRSSLVDWGVELLEWWIVNRREVVPSGFDEEQEAQRLLAQGRLDFLPDHMDRRIVAEALALGCDTLLTLDKKTILKYKDDLSRLGLDALLPSEFVEKYKEQMAGA